MRRDRQRVGGAGIIVSDRIVGSVAWNRRRLGTSGVRGDRGLVVGRFQCRPNCLGAHSSVEKTGGGGENVICRQAEALCLPGDPLQRAVLCVGVAPLTFEGAENAETAVAVLLEAADATAADEIGLIAARGPVILSKAALVFDATVDDAAKKAAKHTQLAAAASSPAKPPDLPSR